MSDKAGDRAADAFDGKAKTLRMRRAKAGT